MVSYKISSGLIFFPLFFLMFLWFLIVCVLFEIELEYLQCSAEWYSFNVILMDSPEGSCLEQVQLGRTLNRVHVRATQGRGGGKTPHHLDHTHTVVFL